MVDTKISRRTLIIGGGATVATIVGGGFLLNNTNVPGTNSSGFNGTIQNLIMADSAVVDSTVQGKYSETILNRTKKMELTGTITMHSDLDKDRAHRAYQAITMRVAKNVVSSAKLEGGFIKVDAVVGNLKFSTVDTLDYLIETGRLPADQVDKVKDAAKHAHENDGKVDLKFYSTLTPDKGY